MIKSTPINRVICITLPSDLADKLDAAAAHERRSRSNMATVIIRSYFEVN